MPIPRIAGNRVLSRGTMTILYQGMASSSNFLFAFLLARHLAENVFGAFVLVYSIATFIIIIAESLIYTPASVFCSGPAEVVERKYDQGVFLAMVAGAILSALLFLGTSGAVLYFSSDSPLVFACMGYAVPFLLYFIKYGSCRLLIVKGHANLATVVQVVYLALLGALLAYFIRGGGFSLLHGYFALTFSSLAAAALGMALVIRRMGRKPGGSIRKSIRENLNFGSWGLLTNILANVGGRIFSFSVAALLGLSATGAIGAYLQVLGPLNMFYSGMRSFALPETMRRNRDAAPWQVWAFIKKIYAYGLVIPLGFLLIIAIWGKPILELVYNGKYLDGYDCIYFLIMFYLVEYFARPLMVAMYALKIPRKLFLPSVLRLAATVVIGIPLIWLWGLNGATLGILVTGLVNMIALAVIFRGHFRGLQTVSRTAIVTPHAYERKSTKSI